MSRSSFAGAGITPGLELWTMEQHLPVKQASMDGHLNSEDSYIILATSEAPSAKSLHHALYLWHGADAVAEDIAAAVGKCTDLSKHLRGCKLHREYQGKESTAFLNLFESVGGLKHFTHRNVSQHSTARPAHDNRPNSEGEMKHRHSSHMHHTDVHGSAPAATLPAPSIFKRVVKESIIAFPSEAHLHVLAFLTSCGIDEAASLRFRQCWSKVVMAVQAFGRRTAAQDAIPNPDLFADELIRELSYSDKDVVRLLRLADLQLGEGGAEQSAHEALQALTRHNDIDRKLAATLAEIYRQVPANDQAGAETSPALLTHSAITMFRASLKGTKMHWKPSKVPCVVGHYSPLDPRLHGTPDSFHGSMVLPSHNPLLKAASALDHSVQASHARDLPLFMATTELQGLRVMPAQPAHQERAWSSYQCLSELLACHHLNLFPLPVGAQREPAGGAVIMAFEALPVRSLHSLSGPVLATYLRKYPSVLLLWCGQLVAAQRALSTHCTSGTLSRAISAARDVFVRENGSLLLGNVAFEGHLHEADSSAEACRQFLVMVCELLSMVLCLSRSEAVTLRDSAADFAAGDDGAAVNGVELAVVAGSCLHLRVSGHGCSSVRIETEAADGSSEESKRSKPGLSASRKPAHSVASEADSGTAVLVVQCEGQHAATAKVSTNPTLVGVSAATDSPTVDGTSVFVHALAPGVFSLKLRANTHAVDDGLYGSAGGGALLRRVECVVRVTVLASHAIASVEALELVGCLEESQLMRRVRGPASGYAEILLSAHCCSERYLAALSDALAVDNSDTQHHGHHGSRRRASLQHDWTEISRAVERLGTRHVNAEHAHGYLDHSHGHSERSHAHTVGSGGGEEGHGQLKHSTHGPSQHGLRGHSETRSSATGHSRSLA